MIRRSSRSICSALILSLCACSTPAPPPPAPAPPPAPVAPPPAPSPFEGSTANVSIRTENALFKSAAFTDLPGWKQDDLKAAWPAFVRSCRVLVGRDNWRDLCTRANTTPQDNVALRAFFEREFVLLSITNIDTTPEGDVTGYYEPLVAGSLVRTDTYSVPVYGKPTDLYVFDWRKLTTAQRAGVIRVKPTGNDLVVAKPGEAGSYALDWSLFTADTRERKLRVRIDGDRVLPYWTRQEIVEQKLGTPTTLAWVQDPLALYAMQIQGAGRIQLPDQSTLRLAFAEQNGQPFRPVRVASKPVIKTRGLRDAGNGPEEFTLEEPEAPAEPAIRTRGARAPTTAPAPLADPGNPAVDDMVAALSRPGTPAKPVTAAKPAASTTAPLTSMPTVPAKPATANAGATSAPASTSPLLSRLSSDPSYVFFRVADEIPAADGPIGALGVSLTPERSVAVDPRATPIGYPLYIAAKPARGASTPIQRLVVAQDTGGAIRGAVRADYFWGYGRDAGRRATGTELRGRMWVMIPRVELPALIASSATASAAPRTRSLSAPAARAPSTCLIADDTYCSD